MSSREIELLRQSAAALRGTGELHAAEQVEAAASRMAAATPAADLDGVRQGHFRLRESEPRPVPRPPLRRSRAEQTDAPSRPDPTGD